MSVHRQPELPEIHEHQRTYIKVHDNPNRYYHPVICFHTVISFHTVICFRTIICFHTVICFCTVMCFNVYLLTRLFAYAVLCFAERYLLPHGYLPGNFQVRYCIRKSLIRSAPQRCTLGWENLTKSPATSLTSCYRTRSP